MPFRKTRSALLVCCIAGTVLGCSWPTFGSNSNRTILDLRALTGTDGPLGPGLGPGIEFRIFDSPVINDAGQWATVGYLGVAGNNNLTGRGIWSADRGATPSHLVLAGDPAPNTVDGALFTNFEYPQITNTGEIIFTGTLDSSLSSDTGYWSVAGGQPITQIAREGEAVPGNPGVTFFRLGGVPSLNDAGHMAFIPDDGADSAIWTYTGGVFTEIVRQYRQVPGFGAGARFEQISRPHIDEDGDVTFQARVDGNGIDFRNEDGIWSNRGGSLAPLMRTGEPAPGTPNGVNFIELSVGSPLVNASGDYVLRSELIGSSVTPDTDRGIWTTAGGALRLVVRRSDPAPGTEPGVLFEGFGIGDFNDDGHVAINGALTGPGVDGGNYLGVWSDVGGNGLALIAREDQFAPGTTGDTRFAEFGGAFLGGDGQIAFTARLKGADVRDPTRSGLWATDPEGELHLVIRRGDVLDVDPSLGGEDLKEVLLFDVIQGDSALNRDDRRVGGFNEAGEIAISVSFTDGTKAIYIATVPEPASLGFMGLGYLLILRRSPPRPRQPRSQNRIQAS